MKKTTSILTAFLFIFSFTLSAQNVAADSNKKINDTECENKNIKENKKSKGFNFTSKKSVKMLLVVQVKKQQIVQLRMKQLKLNAVQKLKKLHAVTIKKQQLHHVVLAKTIQKHLEVLLKKLDKQLQKEKLQLNKEMQDLLDYKNQIKNK